MVIEGVPVPKGRPRFGRGHVCTYLKTKNAEALGVITVLWWIQLTSGLELLIAVGGVTLISFRLAMAYREWRQR